MLLSWVNPDWLKHGKGEPFRSQEEYRLVAYDYKKISMI